MIPSTKGAIEMGYSDHEALSEAEAQLSEQLASAVGQARKHANAGAAKLLIEAGDAAHQHIDKSDKFDDAVSDCLDGGEAPENYRFGQFEANVAVVVDMCAALQKLKDGEVRPESTMPKGGAGIEETRSLKFSDKANAERLEAIYKDDLRHHNGEWYEWDFTRWRADEKGAHLRAKTIGQDIREELLTDGVTDPELSKHYFRAAKNAESARGIRDTLDLAHSMPSFNGDSIEWDSDPWLFNCLNGTVNLGTGAVSSHRRKDFITSLCPTEYHADAQAPRWNEFLSEIFEGDLDLISYLQWIIGYSFTGLTEYHCFFVCWGGGANGKSTLMDTLNHVLGGDYFHTLDPDVLMLHKYPRHLAPVAQLRGKRLVAASESNESRRLNEAQVKLLTGGDSIRADLKHKQPIEFRPVLKLWFLTNHLPKIRDDSRGFWRRVRLIPFAATFEGDSADPHLGSALKAEAEGILTWAIEGAKRVANGEPELPQAVTAAVDEYQHESDLLGQFINEVCCEGEGFKCGRTDFFNAFNSWSWGRCGTQREVAARMRKRPGIEEGRLTGGRKAWVGIGLRADDLQRGEQD